MGKNNIKFTIEEVRRFLSGMDCALVSKEYINGASKLIFKDSKGYFYYNTFHEIKNAKVLKKFYKSNPYTLQNIKLWLKLNNKPYELLSEKYSASNDKMILKDADGYLYLTTLHDLQNGEPQRFHKSNTYTIQNIKLWLVLQNFLLELVSETYENNHTDLTFKDEDGYLYSQNLNNIQQKKLSKFHISNIYTIENIKLWCILNNKSYKLLSDIYNGNDEKLQWKCLKDDCAEVFESKWKNIVQGNNCPFCAGVQIGLSNCLATKRPDVSSSWHPVLNKGLTPYNVTIGYDKKVWWQCLNNPKHEWEASPNSRTNVNSGCPFCCPTHRRSSDDYNLLSDNPELCKEWNYKNNDILPSEYTPSSSQYAWWICKDCDYEWKATIYERNRKDGNATGCPECNSSKGEKVIRNYLKIYNVNFKEQFRIKDCRNRRPLPFDFVVLKKDNNLLFLIEYDGEQHYFPARFSKNKEKMNNKLIQIQKHDKIKDEYCKNNNIRLLRIPYWDFDNIETILDNALKSKNINSKMEVPPIELVLQQ